MITRAREKLIVALDYEDVNDAARLVDTLGSEVSFYKIGLGLQLGGGEGLAKGLIAQGKRVFLDYKYLDIEETIRTAVRRAADFGVDFLTVHGVGGVLRAAVEGRGNARLKLLCVTLLTSMDAGEVKDMGFACSVEELVLARAKKALDAGIDGVVASAREAAQIRHATAGKLLVVAPGIRPQDSASDDQKRVATPSAAIRAGADYLVVGRPITRSPDPKEAVRAIVAEMAASLSA
ncbi:MAG: orotidine-5'-phosphate decarboxylase [Bradyrhizobiaceae bacterium]|nr:orotidine-5'-phosphate decarboxylase [Bradyrhizobiaceae bacterium]